MHPVVAQSTALAQLSTSFQTVPVGSQVWSVAPLQRDSPAAHICSMQVLDVHIWHIPAIGSQSAALSHVSTTSQPSCVALQVSRVASVHWKSPGSQTIV